MTFFLNNNHNHDKLIFKYLSKKEMNIIEKR